MTADLVVLNGHIFTANAEYPWARACAVSDGTFIYVGDDDGAGAHVGPQTTVIDLGGRLVLPGLVESHVHLLLGSLMNVGLQLSMSDKVDDVVAKVSAYAAENPDKAAIFGFGYNAMMFDDQGPHRDIMDAALADRPVLLLDHTLHGAWANTTALRLAGITDATEDPLPSRFVRDAQGHPTGAVKGSGASVPMALAINALPADLIAESMREVLRAMSAYGFTAALDCGNPVATEVALTTLGEIDARGELPLRISLTTMVNTPDMAAIGIETQVRYAAQFRGPNHWFDTLKIIGDSVIDNQTAAMLEPYVTTGDRARLYFDPETLQRLSVEAAERGHGVIMHAIGDWAVREGLNAAEALRHAGHHTSRFILTHCEVVHPDDVARFAHLNVMVQTTSNWAVSFPGHRRHLGEERDSTCRQPMRSWEDSGAVLALGADWPATPGGLEHGLNPFVNIYTAMHRRVPDSLLAEWDASPQPLEPVDEVLTVEEAVRAYTINGAIMLGRQDMLGSIEVGKSADFAVVDRDIFTIDPAEIPQAQILETVFRGRSVYRPADAGPVSASMPVAPGGCPGCQGSSNS